MKPKRGFYHTIAAVFAAGAGMLYTHKIHANEARLPLTETLQLRLSDDNMPATMDREGRMKLNRLGLDLELKLQEWLVPYIRGESSAFDYENSLFNSGRRGSFPQSQPAAGLEGGAGLRIPLYENKSKRERLDAELYCGVGSLAREYCFAGLGWRF